MGNHVLKRYQRISLLAICFNKDNALAKYKIGLKECIEKQIINNIPEKRLKKGNVYIFRDTF